MLSITNFPDDEKLKIT